MGIVERFLKWSIDPFLDLLEKRIDDNNCNNSDEGISKVNIITEPKSSFRPLNFDEFIGQKNIKEILQVYLEETKRRNITFPHTLLSANAGYGKTTLAYIIAKELNKNIKTVIASDIKQASDIILLSKNDILFLDEIHSIEREIAEKFYSVMEEFKYNNYNITPFTLIGATTEVGEIIKNRKPFYDRFKLILEYENYDIEDLSKLACQYKNKMFRHDSIDNYIYFELSKNCRGTPRTLIRLLESIIYFSGNYSKAFRLFGILKEGYTTKDFKVLEYLASNIKGVGLNSISSYLGTSDENYLSQIEPYLLQTGLIARTGRGRKITDKGILKLKELHNVLS